MTILRQQREVARRVLGRSRLAVAHGPGREIHLAADNRLDPGFLRRLVELDSPEHVAMVGHRHRRHPVASGFFHQVLDADRAVEQRILRVQMEVDEGVGGRGVGHQTKTVRFSVQIVQPRTPLKAEKHRILRVRRARSTRCSAGGSGSTRFRIPLYSFNFSNRAPKSRMSDGWKFVPIFGPSDSPINTGPLLWMKTLCNLVVNRCARIEPADRPVRVDHAEIASRDPVDLGEVAAHVDPPGVV